MVIWLDFLSPSTVFWTWISPNLFVWKFKSEYTYNNNEITPNFTIGQQPITLSFQPTDNTIFWQNSQLVRQPTDQQTGQPTGQPTGSGPFHRLEIPTNRTYLGSWASPSMNLEIIQRDTKAIEVVGLSKSENYVVNMGDIQYYSDSGITDIKIPPIFTFRYLHSLDTIMVVMNNQKNIVLTRRS